MDQQLKRLRALVKFARKSGITRLRSNDIEFDLAPPAPKVTGREVPDMARMPSVPSDVTKSPFLLWSAPDWGMDTMEGMNDA